MTTIPPEAVAAGHAAASLCRAEHPEAQGPWACCITAALETALPYIGDTTTEYGIECDTFDRRHRVAKGHGLSRESTADLMSEIPQYNPTLVERNLITGPWRKETPSE